MSENNSVPAGELGVPSGRDARSDEHSAPAVVIERLRAALDMTRDFIDLMPHGDNCFLDSNRPDIHRCWCGKDSMLEHIDGALEETEEQGRSEAEHAPNPQGGVDP